MTPTDHLRAIADAARALEAYSSIYSVTLRVREVGTDTLDELGRIPGARWDTEVRDVPAVHSYRAERQTIRVAHDTVTLQVGPVIATFASPARKPTEEEACRVW